jgi:hypothetical protein
LAKDINPEYKGLIKTTTEQEKETMSGVIGDMTMNLAAGFILIRKPVKRPL